MSWPPNPGEDTEYLDLADCTICGGEFPKMFLGTNLRPGTWTIQPSKSSFPFKDAKRLNLGKPPSGTSEIYDFQTSRGSPSSPVEVTISIKAFKAQNKWRKMLIQAKNLVHCSRIKNQNFYDLTKQVEPRLTAGPYLCQSNPKKSHVESSILGSMIYLDNGVINP